MSQAATIYDQEGTRVDLYGRIHYVLATGGPQSIAEGARKSNGSRFENRHSRFGFRASHQLDADIRLFARAEFRFRADAQNTDNLTIRNSFVGLQSRRYGTFTLGNFDSVHREVVTNRFSKPDYESSFTTLDSGSISSRGDSLAYSSPVLAGVQAHAQVKHASGNGAPIGEADNSSALSAAAAVSYTWQDLYLAAGYNQSRDLSGRGASYDGGGGSASGEDLWGVVATYGFTPAFSARVIHEHVGSVREDAPATATESIWGVGATFDYGLGELYGDIYRVSAVGDDVSTSTRWALGANYRFSNPMYAYAEIYDYDVQGEEIDNDPVYVLGVRYDF